MAEVIRLETGVKSYAVEFPDRGVTAEISFNPSDPDLAIRFTELEDRVRDRIAGIPEIEVDENGVPKDLSFVNNLKQLNEVLYSEIDYAFGAPVSKTVFQFCNPLATVKGNYFILNFISAVAPIIEAEARKNNAAAEQRMNKHIGQYRKGKK